VAIALGVAVALSAAVLVGVLIARRGSGDTTAPTTGPSTSAAASSTTLPATTTSTVGRTTSTLAPAPTTAVAVSDQKVVLVDTATGRPVRTLFDLGPSTPTTPSPPAIGSVALSADGQTAFFDVIGTTPTGTMKRVPTRGGAAEDLGAGRAPSPSPDGSLLAFIRSSDSGKDTVLLRGNDGNEREVTLDASACGGLAWAPDSGRLAVDLCAEGEPTTVAEIDAADAKAATLSAPNGVRWTAPAYRGDGTLTLAEDRSGDSVVVTVAGGRVTGTVLRRDRTTLGCLDWDRARALLFCETDGSVWAAGGEGDPHVVGTGYHDAAW
jgi:hypothetical protein